MIQAITRVEFSAPRQPRERRPRRIPAWTTVEILERAGKVCKIQHRPYNTSTGERDRGAVFEDVPVVQLSNIQTLPIE